MTYEQAETVAKELSKHNPFVRMTTKQQQQAEQADQAEQAHRTLQKQVPMKVVEDAIF